MTSDLDGLGLADRDPPPEPAPRRRSAPPFRRRSGTPRPLAPRGLDGLSVGGTTADLAGVDRGRRIRGALVSSGLHVLLLLLTIGGAIPLPGTDAVPVEPESERPLLTFEAPAVEEEALAPPLIAEAVPVEPVPEAEPVPEPPAPPQTAQLQIPEAMIARPSTGFQNDLPFADGPDEQFYFDQPMGDEDALAEAPVPTPPAPDPDPEPAFEPVPDAPPEMLADAGSADPGDPSRLDFDADAFRRLLADPAGDARRRADEIATRAARARAEEADRRRGIPTDIWRFLEGKRFRNPEGGLVSNRNNTLYYDDRGANMVPWIGRLIAEVRRNWYVPYAAAFQAGHVAIAISVLRDGTLEWMQVVIPSGTRGFDNAAVGALRGAELLPLPDDYPGRNFEIMLVFWYNEQPYDIFGSAP